MGDERYDICARCEHRREVHEPHCVVTYWGRKKDCQHDCREFVEAHRD